MGPLTSTSDCANLRPHPRDQQAYLVENDGGERRRRLGESMGQNHDSPTSTLLPVQRDVPGRIGGPPRGSYSALRRPRVQRVRGSRGPEKAGDETLPVPRRPGGRGLREKKTGVAHLASHQAHVAAGPSTPSPSQPHRRPRGARKGEGEGVGEDVVGARQSGGHQITTSFAPR